MPDPTNPEDVWCEVCQEWIPKEYAHAHAEQATPEALERLRDMRKPKGEDAP